MGDLKIIHCETFGYLLEVSGEPVADVSYTADGYVFNDFAPDVPEDLMVVCRDFIAKVNQEKRRKALDESEAVTKKRRAVFDAFMSGNRGL